MSSHARGPFRAAVSSTAARAAASRANGAKSRGPRTAEGKARSAQNALKHGLSARKHVLLPDDSRAEFKALEGALLEELRPEGALQTLLVHRLVAAAWRLARADRLEFGLLTGDGALESPGRVLVRDGRAAGVLRPWCATGAVPRPSSSAPSRRLGRSRPRPAKWREPRRMTQNCAQTGRKATRMAHETNPMRARSVTKAPQKRQQTNPSHARRGLRAVPSGSSRPPARSGERPGDRAELRSRTGASRCGSEQWSMKSPAGPHLAQVPPACSAF